MTETAVEKKIIRDEDVRKGLMALVPKSGENSRDHGFHDDWPKPRKMPFDSEVEQNKADQRRAIAEKLALIHEEVSEALGEIRSGRDPLEVYYVSKETGIEYEEQQYDVYGVPTCKPEGFLVELADALIRIADLAYLAGDLDGVHLASAALFKGEYNETRPYKHGRKF